MTRQAGCRNVLQKLPDHRDGVGNHVHRFSTYLQRGKVNDTYATRNLPKDIRPMKLRYKLLILVAILILGFGTNNARAHASVRQSWTATSVDCWKYHVQEYRRGVLDLNDLWRLSSTVRW